MEGLCQLQSHDKRRRISEIKALGGCEHVEGRCGLYLITEIYIKSYACNTCIHTTDVTRRNDTLQTNPSFGLHFTQALDLFETVALVLVIMRRHGAACTELKGHFCCRPASFIT